MDTRLKHLKESWKKISEEEILPGGQSDDMTIEDVAAFHADKSGKKYEDMLAHIKKQVEIGMEVEKEHSADTKIRLKITLDHLAEDDPDYYSKLITIIKDYNP